MSIAVSEARETAKERPRICVENFSRISDRLILCTESHFSQSTILSPCLQAAGSIQAKSHSASQEISLFLRKPKVHYRVHNSPPILRLCVTFRNMVF